MQLFNTLSRKLEEFIPLSDKQVSFYHCGPTVYSTQHIGNLRGMTMGDLVRRTLQYLDYKIIYVRNYTDVGHLVSDADEGEDKMIKGAKREKISPIQVADKYIGQFERDTKHLNLLEPNYKPRATEYVPEMIEMVKTLLAKGFAYQTDLAIYFDTSKFKNYSELSGQILKEQELGAGKGKIGDDSKRQAQDFALWFFKKGEHAQAIQVWDSPWGIGFPGWHLECSVMSKKLLGKTIDIHMGGVEHVAIHHTNEIAQSEAANNAKFVNYWLHNEHLLVDSQKMAKSKGTSYVLQDIVDKGFSPLDLRYLFLQAHYRSSQNFTWQALEASKTSRQNLLQHLYEINLQPKKPGKVLAAYKQMFTKAISQDINIPKALSIVWDLLISQEEPENVVATIFDFDKVLGLRLAKSLDIKIPQKITELASTRNSYRLGKDYANADKIRKQIDKAGYLIKDKNEEYLIIPKQF